MVRRLYSATLYIRRGVACSRSWKLYRGIYVLYSSCLGNFLTLILNSRFNTFLGVNEILNKYQIGFRHGFRTSDHKLVLKTLIDIELTCLIYFRKTCVWRGLFFKLIQYGYSRIIKFARFWPGAPGYESELFALYADDLVLISQSESGLQESLSKLEYYVKRWRLKINLKKCKVLILVVYLKGFCIITSNWRFEGDLMSSWVLSITYRNYFPLRWEF
jgi:hypothetical protein